MSPGCVEGSSCSENEDNAYKVPIDKITQRKI